MPATGPIDRILRGGGSVVVLATGAILATPAAGRPIKGATHEEVKIQEVADDDG